MHKAKCHDSRHDDVVRNGLVRVDVHDMVDDHVFAGHQDKQKSAFLIEPQCYTILSTSQTTAYCMREVLPYRAFSDRRGRQIMSLARCIQLCPQVPLTSPVVHCDQQRSVLLLGVYTVRSSDRPVGPTQATSDCLSNQSDRPVGQTVAEPPTSVNQINVAC